MEELNSIKPIILITAVTGISQRGTREHRISDGYIKMIEEAGGIPLLAFSDDEALPMLADGLLLPGGGDIVPEFFGERPLFDNLSLDREKDEQELSLLKQFLKRGKPVFGVCRGMQLINVALGGTLWQDLPGQLGVTHTDTSHEVTSACGTTLCELFGGKFRVNSYHHQAVKKPADGIRVSALSPDGVIEAIEHERLPVSGVQWHPEKPADDMPDMRPLFRQLVEGAGK